MSGKFMKVKKIVIPVLTLVMIASQLSGCASTGKQELANMIDNSQEVIIEVETPEFTVQGESEDMYWTQLSLLSSNENTREIVDNYFSNYLSDTGVKYGPFYVDKDGNQEGNNTLAIVLGNKYVADVLNGVQRNVDGEDTVTVEDSTEATAAKLDENAVDDMMNEISQYLTKDYADLEESDYSAAMFNAYFELIPDSTPNYFNGGASLTRAEAMTLVMRAVTPVETLKADENFKNSVAGTKYDEYIGYASKEDSKVYISTADKSLSKDNFSGAMTRGEYIYLIMNEVYGAESVKSFNIDGTSLKDCVNAGDLASSLEFKGTERIHAACLQYALQNADKGAPEELYKAVAMAHSKDIISSETRWDEAITKTEAIEILVSALQSYYEENGYLCDNAEGGSTAALEAAAKELWEKQDKNDMKCTEEEFIADYVEFRANGATEEQFIEGIEMDYSIKWEKAEAEKIKKAQKEAEEKKKKAEEQKKKEESQSSSSSSGSDYSYEEPDYSYEEPDYSYEEPDYSYEEPDNSYQEPVYEEPAAPPADNGGVNIGGVIVGGEIDLSGIDNSGDFGLDLH
jgi:hypothetical protein